MSADIKICVIDSGVSEEFYQKHSKKLNGLTVSGDSEKGFKVENGFVDDIGHGTAVCSILGSGCPEANIFMLKIFNKDFETNEELLIYALEYIHNNIECNIIHVSAGITHCFSILKLKTICDILYRKGCIIVAAFDNAGGVSYPAAFSSVIGVDMDIDILNPKHFYFVKNSYVNVRGIGSEQRLPWINGSYKFLAGSSFSAPHITAFVAKIMLQGICGHDNILDELATHAIGIREKKNNKIIAQTFKTSEIKRAILFPLNKEIHSIIRYYDLLPFTISHVCDTKYTGNTKQSIKNLVGNINSEYIIENIDDINWSEDFDTVILGHLDKHLLVDKNIIEKVLDKCTKYQKKVYSFDIIPQRPGLFCFCANDKSSELQTLTFGKLRSIAKPIVGVFGTSSRQGKFTVQLSLRKYFLSAGYDVGQLGTEPSSLLFGFDQMHTTGYNSGSVLTADQEILIMNQKMGLIEDRNPDLIICGGQSLTVPLNYGNIGHFPVTQYCTLLACQPDIVVLCVNIFDDIEYIKRTFTQIECLIDCKVVALVVSPFTQALRWSTISSRREVADVIMLSKKRELLKDTFHLPIIDLFGDLSELYDICLSCF